MHWWFIKVYISYKQKQTYCEEIYPDWQISSFACSNQSHCDYQCDIYVSREPVSVVSCSCHFVAVLPWLIIIFLNGLGIGLFRAFICNWSTKGPRLNYDCSLLCLYRDFVNEDLYLSRELWKAPDMCTYPLLFHIIDHMIRYGISIGFAVWFIAVPDDELYWVEWYDLLPVLIVLIIKILLQIWYKQGEPYNKATDEAMLVMSVLDSIFGEHIAHIVRFYIPRFYDSELLTNELYLEDLECTLQQIADERQQELELFTSSRSY